MASFNVIVFPFFSFTETVAKGSLLQIKGAGIVLPGRVYTCYMFMTYSELNSNTSSARTYSVQVTTKERKGKYLRSKHCLNRCLKFHDFN